MLYEELEHQRKALRALSMALKYELAPMAQESIGPWLEFENYVFER